MTFNVLTDPWIPTTGGKLSLLDAFENAHVIEGVQCVTPLETVAVYRLMIAFAMDALQLPSRDDRMASLERARFDMTDVRAYITRCAEESVSFDLFNARRPFMQAMFDPKWDKEPKPASNMALTVPSGNNHTFFDHHAFAKFAPDEALRQLLTSYLFCTAAIHDYPSSVNNTPCVYVLLQGKNLFETLVLNMLSIAECGNIAYGKPAWRTACQVVPKKEFAQVDMLSALTWQPRRVTTIPDEDGSITRIYWQQGHNFKGNALWRDPHVPYQLKKGKYSSLKPEKGRALWRDLGALAASRNENHGWQPLVVVQNRREDEPLCRLFLTGLITSKASPIDFIAENVNLPQSVLYAEDCGDVLRRDLLFFEDCAQALNFAVKDLYHGVLGPILMNTFFAYTHDYIYNEYLQQLGNCEDDEEFVALRDTVHEQALRMLLNTLDREMMRFGNEGRMMIEQAKIRKTVIAIYYKKRRERECMKTNL